MNFTEHYFSEKKKSPKKKKNRKGGYNHSSYFSSDKYDKKVSGTMDLNLVGESLDTKVDIKWNSLPGGFGELGYFNIDGKDFEISFTNRGEDFHREIFEILFWQSENKNDDDEYGIIGNVKNSLKVFGAIANIIQEWVEKNKPVAFYFSAKEPSRIQLYNRFAKLIQRQTDYYLDEELNDEVTNLYDVPWKFYTFSKR